MTVNRVRYRLVFQALERMALAAPPVDLRQSPETSAV
jgi:hypothetical protein